jgi:single-stranded-DNA-specific exonuclease
MNVNKVWRQRPTPADLVAELEHELGLSRLTSRILAGRGVRAADAERYLAKRLKDCHPPGLLRDMDTAATRLAAAIDRRETILIHGDYDVDGSTSTVLLKLFCRACRHDAVAWIPHRRIDGYGLGESSLHAVQEHSAKLMITVDCGIADQGWAARIERETGCQVIITDHHLPQGELPACTAVVNPNRGDCSYPDKGLAGVGVAWKLAWATAQALCHGNPLPEELRQFLLDSLALVAVGTVADCAPLDGENRILVEHGLKALGQTRNLGLRALLDQARLEAPIEADEIGWRLGPLLNASGRLGSAMRNVHLLTSSDPVEVERLLGEIVAENDERRRLSHVLTEELMAEIERHPARYAERRTLVFAGDGWHQGVVGIVASRLTERFAKPTAVIAIADGEAKGSLRTPAGVHLGQAIDRCREHLRRGGGHAMAAGITLDPERVEPFWRAFESAVAEAHPAGLPPAGINHDGLCILQELDGGFFQELARLGPFGQGNPQPTLLVRNARFVARPEVFGQGGRHLRGAVTDPAGGIHQLMAWGQGERYAHFSRSGHRFDALVRPELSRFRGSVSHRLVLVDETAPVVAL